MNQCYEVDFSASLTCSRISVEGYARLNTPPYL